jgi:hypothetical protein
MRYLYQKDERALPGNLLSPIHRFFLPYSKCSVLHYFATSLSLSLSVCLQISIRIALSGPRSKTFLNQLHVSGGRLEKLAVSHSQRWS